MSGFGGMSKQDQSPGDQPTAHQLFVDDVNTIFPNAAASRLARACGNVNPRTAEKWLADKIKVPQDVLEFVATQKAALAANGFHAALQLAIENHATGVDREVIASYLAAAYFEFTGSAVE